MSRPLLFDNFDEVKSRDPRLEETAYARLCCRAATSAYAQQECCRQRPSGAFHPKRAFTLVEVVICLLIVMMAAVATFSAVTYVRLNLELEKQRLAALNYCRQGMELVQSLRTVHSDTKSLVPFINPDLKDLDADLKVEYYKLNPNGSVNWSSPLATPSNEDPTFAQVTVSWVPYGSMARPQAVSMSTILTMGIN